MKTAKEYAKSLKLNRSNVEHILQYGTVNGSLMIDIEAILKEYAKQVAEQALKDAADNATASTIYEDPFDFYNTTIRGYEIDKESITDTEIKLP